MSLLRQKLNVSQVLEVLSLVSGEFLELDLSRGAATEGALADMVATRWLRK